MEELSKLESILQQILTANLDLKTKVKEQDKDAKNSMKEFFISIISVIDSLESKEENLIERYANIEVGLKIIQSYSSIQKQLFTILTKHGVTKLEYPNNKLIVGYCKVVDTEPEPSKENDTIISIVKNGYIRGSELIREAELIVVKN